MYLTECTFPNLAEPYRTALKEAVAYIAGRFNAIGILAAGSIIRGAPDASSDLDLYVIQRAEFRQRLQKRFNGVFAEMFVNPPTAIQKYFTEEQASRRPLTAHMLATGFVVFQSDPIVSELRAKAAQLLASPPPIIPAEMTYTRYLAAVLYEDAVDKIHTDPPTAQMLLHQAIAAMLQFAFVSRGLFLPRGKDLLEELASLNPTLASDARGYFSANNLDDQFDYAGGIVARTIQTRGSFEWESEPEEVLG